MTYTDKEREKFIKHKHYIENKALYLQRTTKKRKELIKFLQEYKNTLSCTYCTESCSCCIDFHHLNESKKFDNIGSMMNCGSLEKLKKELKKCIPVCSNCHRKIHAGIIKICD